MGLPSACHNPHPQKQAEGLRAHRPLGRSLHCHRAALPNASRLQKELSTPCPTPPFAPSPGLGTPGPRARSPLVQSTTCLGLHLVTGSMVNGSTPSWARGGGKVLLPGPPCPPGGRAPRLSPRARAPGQSCMAAVSGACSAARRGRRGPLPAHGTACGSSVQLQLLLLPPPPPPGARHCCGSRAIAAAGTRGCDPLGPGPGRSRPLLRTPAPAPAPPGRGVLSGAPAPRARPSASAPARRSHLRRLPPGSSGAGSGAEPERSGYKVSARVAAPGIKAGAGPAT